MILRLLHDWIAPLCLIVWAITCVYVIATHPDEHPAPAVTQPFLLHAPTEPRREEEPDEDELATPGQYAANHSTTNTP